MGFNKLEGFKLRELLRGVGINPDKCFLNNKGDLIIPTSEIKEDNLSDKLEKFKKDWEGAIGGEIGIDATNYCGKLFKDFIDGLKSFIMFAGDKKFTSKDICQEINRRAGEKLI